MTADLESLFDEWAARLARGEGPDPADYIGRAGREGDELARLMERLLLSTPEPEADQATVEMVRAWEQGEAPLVALRKRRKLGRDDVVDAIMRAFSLRVEQREKVKRYYGELESGRLDPADLSAKLGDFLARTLGVRPGTLGLLRRQLGPQPAMFRMARPMSALEVAPATVDPRPDEVDRLFQGGP